MTTPEYNMRRNGGSFVSNRLSFSSTHSSGITTPKVSVDNNSTNMITAPTPTSRSTETSSSASSGADALQICSWGTDVSVTDETARAINLEIRDIDKNMSSLQGNLKNEKSELVQLDKDFTHARNEMLSLRQSMEDNLNAIKMNEQIRQTSASSQEAIVVHPIMTKDDDKTNTNTSKDGDDDSDNCGGNKENDNPLSAGINEGDPNSNVGGLLMSIEEMKAIGHKSFLFKHKSEGKKVTRSILNLSKEGKNKKALLQALNDECDDILKNKIEKQHLNEQLAEAKNDEELQRKVHDLKVQCRTNKEDFFKIDQSKYEISAKELRELNAAFNTKKSKYDTKEAEFKQRIELAEEEMRSLVRRDQPIQAKLHRVTKCYDLVEKHTTELASIETVREKVDTLRSSIKEAKQIESSLDSCLKRFEKDEIEKIQPGHVELKALVRTEKDITLRMNNMQKERAEFGGGVDGGKQKKKVIDDDEFTALDGKIKSFKEQLKTVQVEKERKKGKIDDIARKRGKEHDAMKKDIDASEIVCSKYDEDIKADTKQMEQVEKQKNLELDENMIPIQLTSKRINLEVMMVEKAAKIKKEMDKRLAYIAEMSTKLEQVETGETSYESTMSLELETTGTDARNDNGNGPDNDDDCTKTTTGIDDSFISETSCFEFEEYGDGQDK